jgi:hypothetical protein
VATKKGTVLSILLALTSLTLFTSAASAEQPGYVRVYSGGSVTTSAGAWTGSGVLYPDRFDLTAGDLTLYVQDVDMTASRSQNWRCPYATPLPAPTFKTGLQFGVTNLASLGTGINPRKSAWQNIMWSEWDQVSDYIAQQWYRDAMDQFQGPGLEWNPPFRGPFNNGGYHCTGDSEYERFDLKLVFHNLGVGSGFRVYAYQRIHKTMGPGLFQADKWIAMLDAPGYQDVPEAAMDKTALTPFVFVSNWDYAAGGGTIAWGSVVAITAPPSTVLVPKEKEETGIAVDANPIFLWQPLRARTGWTAPQFERFHGLPARFDA